MEPVLAIVIGGLYAAGIYLMVRRSVIKTIFGLALLGNGTNLLIFTVGRLSAGRPPYIPEGATEALSAVADPLPQALVLTAIVIGFGVQAFALVLVKRVYQTVGSDDLDQMTMERWKKKGPGAGGQGPEEEREGQGSGVKGQESQDLEPEGHGEGQE